MCSYSARPIQFFSVLGLLLIFNNFLFLVLLPGAVLQVSGINKTDFGALSAHIYLLTVHNCLNLRTPKFLTCMLKPFDVRASCWIAIFENLMGPLLFDMQPCVWKPFMWSSCNGFCSDTRNSPPPQEKGMVETSAAATLHNTSCTYSHTTKS